ncbi:MAG: SDR family NAD(P)-dependent oxidoreductase, partial [Alphaproteobacteria bacterium]
PQYLVMCGEGARIQRLLKLSGGGGVTSSAAPIVAPHTENLSEQPLLARVEDDLLNMASQLLHVARERLALDRNLAGFGFDSINMAAFSVALSNRYSIEVMPSIFFSFPTLGRLAQHFTEQHREAVEACYREAATAAQEHPKYSAEVAHPASTQLTKPAKQTSADDSIVVIGMSGRFPGARSIAEMWNILAEGRNAITRAPADRDGGWTESEYRCGFVPGVSEFDPLFFEISPREADSMDPRQRLLLQETWKALEDAGYGAAQLSAGCTGIFTGIEDGDYQRLDDPESAITSNHNGILAGRLAYHLDVTGPVLSINTACSSGLVALHQACQSLRNDECDTAIVAAANLFLTPHLCRQMDEAGMLSPNATSYAFDERANGMVPGEAVAVLVLKRLSQAKASNDRIHAVIAGSGVNSDGRTNGITAPNGISQTRLIESVYRKAAIDPEQIDYVVAHGTGTKLGDPVEVNAIIEAFRSFTQRSGYCALTSPKNNLGHTLAASGLVSVISLIEAMRHETIPASLHWETPNPFIQFQASPFFVNVANRHWPRGHSRARMGAVSSFGMSGTNAHVVVQEYAGSDPEPTQAQASLPCHLFVLSAKTEKALRQKIADMIAFFEVSVDDSATLASISYTLLERRHHFNHRIAFIADSAEEAVGILREADRLAPPNYFSGKAPADFRPDPALQQEADTLAAQYLAANVQTTKFREGLCALASLYCQGYVFKLAALVEPTPPKVVSLPEYPFSKGQTILRKFSAHGWIDHVIWHAPYQPQSAQADGNQVIQDQENGVLACFHLIKALLALGYGERELNWYVITERSQALSASDAINAAHSGLHGLIGSLAKEHPNWKIRLADVPSVDAVPMSDLLALPPDRRGHAQVYRYGEWYRRHLVSVHPVGEYQAPYRHGGVYIVLGGAGDIGAAWSKHMIARYGAKIIWVGRREKDAQIEAKLERLVQSGTAPLYFQADAGAGKLDELQALRSSVLDQYGAIHGVIHAAMVFGNHDLADMTESQFKAALYAKVNVSVRLSQVFGSDPLDFLLFFSSMISLIKNPKQAHYAAGCTFNDAFAHQLAQDMSCPVKVVNWGYWAAEKNAMMPEVRQLNELGVGLIEPGDGMRALDVLLGSSLPQLGVMQLTKSFEVEGMNPFETINLYPAPKASDGPDTPPHYGLLGGL